MKKNSLFFWAMVILTVVVSLMLISPGADAATKKKGTKCFILYQNPDCFGGDFQLNPLTWDQSLVTLDYDVYFFMMEEIMPNPGRKTCGNWAMWSGAFFMSVISDCASPPNAIPDHPFYGGTISGVSKGQGFMAEEKGGSSNTTCWYLKKVTRELTSLCPKVTATDKGMETSASAGTEPDEADGDDLEEP